MGLWPIARCFIYSAPARLKNSYFFITTPPRYVCLSFCNVLTKYICRRSLSVLGFDNIFDVPIFIPPIRIYVLFLFQSAFQERTSSPSRALKGRFERPPDPIVLLPSTYRATHRALKTL